jgi:hypothetical protein
MMSLLASEYPPYWRRENLDMLSTPSHVSTSWVFLAEKVTILRQVLICSLVARHS